MLENLKQKKTKGHSFFCHIKITFYFKHDLKMIASKSPVDVSYIKIYSNPVFWVPVSLGKVLMVLRPLPNR